MECIVSTTGKSLDIVCENEIEITIMLLAVTSLMEAINEGLQEQDPVADMLKPLSEELRTVCYKIASAVQQITEINGAQDEVGDIAT